MVTAVPPDVGPLLGETLLMFGAAMQVNPLGRLPFCPPGFLTVTATGPAVPAGVVAVIWVPLITVTFVAATLPNVTVAPVTKFIPTIVTAVPPVAGPLLGLTLLTVGTGPETAENATICMTHGPEEPRVAVALLLPAVVTTLSSAMSPSGEVMIREVNPVPAEAVVVPTISAPNINSLARVVVADPLLAAVPLPLAPEVTSTAVIPRYSRMRTSGKAAG